MPENLGYGRQYIDDEDIRLVVETLQSDWLTQGPRVREFEEAMQARFEASRALAVANGTAGLHLVGLAFGWKAGDLILTTPLTFLASANCALYVGARPDFADVDESSGLIDPNRLEERLQQLDGEGRRPRAVVAVDYAGLPCDWQALRELANRYELELIADACHAIGATYKEKPIGSDSLADASVFSFHPVKNITTAEGGAVLTGSSALADRIADLRTHGMIRDPQRLEDPEQRETPAPWYYEMQNPGFNYRISDLQCALGIGQLRKLDFFLERRRAVAAQYDRLLADDERFRLPASREDCEHAYHLYALRIPFQKLGVNKTEYFQALRAKQIFCQVHYIPVHLQPYYRKNFGYKPGDFPVAEAFYTDEISIPIFPSLTEENVEYVVQTLRAELERLAS